MKYIKFAASGNKYKVNDKNVIVSRIFDDPSFSPYKLGNRINDYSQFVNISAKEYYEGCKFVKINDYYAIKNNIIVDRVAITAYFDYRLEAKLIPVSTDLGITLEEYLQVGVQQKFKTYEIF